MAERIPQSVVIRVPLKVYVTADQSDATGKTVAITISKNGAAFGNPSAGATNATEIANGWYYVDLSTTDTNTGGPLIVKGTATSCDNSEVVYAVVNQYNAGFGSLPNVAAEASGGVYTRGTGAGQINQTQNGQIDVDAKRFNNSSSAATNAQSHFDTHYVYNIDTAVTTPTTTVFEIITANNTVKFPGQRLRIYVGTYAGMEFNIISATARTSTRMVLTVEAMPAALTSSDSIQLVGRATSTAFDLLPSYTVGSGSSTTEVRTDCAESTGAFLPGTPIIIFREGRYLHAMDITDYNSTNGAFTLATALPFTPASGDVLKVCGWIKTS